jgi:hypothetical protein
MNREAGVHIGAGASRMAKGAELWWRGKLDISTREEKSREKKRKRRLQKHKGQESGRGSAARAPPPSSLLHLTHETSLG